MEQVSIINFDVQYAADFKRLNLEWLDKYELTEEADLLMLDHPQREILDTGGVIFLAKAGAEIAGSAALIQEKEGEFELAKMSVSSAFQGKGISKVLLDRCLAEAKKSKAKKIFLFSNSQLITAIKLYEKYGFRQVEVTDSPMLTADVKMELLCTT